MRLRPTTLDQVSRDEDALRWEGDDDLDRASFVDRDDAREAPRASAPVAPARERGPVALRWLFLLLALAATAGWAVIVWVNPVQQPSLLGLAMYQLGELLALVAPFAWWFVVDRVASVRTRPAWWLAGLVVTAPWPLVAGMLA